MDMHKGMKNVSPKAPSETPKGKSVDADATRSATRSNQKTLGPREA